jgi:DNA-binding FadR family transcriptional regulator
MGRDLASLLDRIRLLLKQEADPSVPILTELEHTLTDGYAVALELQGYRLRLERQIGELAQSVDGPEQAEELKDLAQQLRATDEDLASLRELLPELQRRVGVGRAVA